MYELKTYCESSFGECLKRVPKDAFLHCLYNVIPIRSISRTKK